MKSREALSRQEVLLYLNEEVEAKAKRWGEDYIYTQWAREHRDATMAKFDAGEVVEVYEESYCASYGNGTGDFKDILFSDGHVETVCYGYAF